MKLTDNQKEDLIATRDYWAFAAESGDDGKDKWPEYKRIEGLLNLCYFCEYIRITRCSECEYIRDKGNRSLCSISDDECYCIECKNCYLFVKNMCGHNGSVWNLLSKEKNIDQRKQYAKQILDVIEEFIKREV